MAITTYVCYDNVENTTRMVNAKSRARVREHLHKDRTTISPAKRDDFIRAINDGIPIEDADPIEITEVEGAGNDE